MTGAEGNPFKAFLTRNKPAAILPLPTTVPPESGTREALDEGEPHTQI